MIAAIARERGSALLLFPAGVMVVIVMAAITVDFTLVFLAQREAQDAAAQAANDAVNVGIDRSAYFAGSGDVSLDLGRAQTAAATSISARQATHLQELALVSVTPGGDPLSLQVTTSATVRSIFAPALPGGWTTRTIRGQASARAAVDG